MNNWVDNLNVSERTRNCLKRSGIRAEEQLYEYVKAHRYLRGFGNKCIDEINQNISESIALNSSGRLCFSKEIPKKRKPKNSIPINWIEEYICTHPASTDIYFKWMIDEWKREREK